jgi:hypothetical protein
VPAGQAVNTLSHVLAYWCHLHPAACWRDRPLRPALTMYYSCYSPVRVRYTCEVHLWDTAEAEKGLSFLSNASLACSTTSLTFSPTSLTVWRTTSALSPCS